MSLSVPVTFPPAPTPCLEHVDQSANSILLVKDCDLNFIAEALLPSAVLKVFVSQPIHLGEVLVQGSEDSGCSELASSVSASLQQMKSGGNETGHLFNLKLSEWSDQYALCVELNENFVRKMRSLLLAPFLTLQGTLFADSDPDTKYDFDGETQLDLCANDELMNFSLEIFLKKTSLRPENVHLCVKGKLTSVSLGWRVPEGSEMQISAESLLRNILAESPKDLTIVAGNGAELKCHRRMFQAHSPVLAAMISPENGMKEGQTGRIEMKEYSEEAVERLLRYLYGVWQNTDNMDCDEAVELFKMAHKYELPYLEICMRELLLRKGKEWFGPNEVLELYYHVRNVEEWKKLREHSLRIMTSMPSELRSCARFKELSLEEMNDLIWKLFDFKGTD